MKKYIKYLLFVLAISSCVATNKTFDKKEYKKSRAIATYSGMGNELQDGYLVLKENNYFTFYQKSWLLVSIKQGECIGRYSQNNDTLYLNWPSTDPRQIKDYLSRKCLIDTGSRTLWFVDDSTNEKLWQLRLALNR
jgi:hypothetical protein